MEENVALDSTKQSKFVKSIRGIKKLIKKNESEVKSKPDKNDKVKSGKVNKKKRKERGLVYLAHIPHGFYEHEMTQYFRQFGVVTNARVIKSQKTGRSKGYAFVEFKQPSVGEIVAETMNNYLMGKRLIKAVYIPPEKQKRKAFRRHWTATNNPGNNLRIKMKKEHNKDKSEKEDLQRARKLLANIKKTKKKLSELGIKYDFFTPVDMPEALVENKEIKVEKEHNKVNMTSKDKVNKKKDNNDNKKTKDKAGKVETVQVKSEKADKTKTKIKNEKKDQIEVTKSTQNKKKQNLQDNGVTLLEDFIKIKQESDNESDSSDEFDSDAYEKMLGEDNSDASDAENDDGDEESDIEDSDDSIDEESEEEEELPMPKKKSQVPVAKNQFSKNKDKKQEAQQKGSVKNISKPEILKKELRKGKRQTLQVVAPVSSKKPKFEKQTNQAPRNKQFKKKKISN